MELEKKTFVTKLFRNNNSAQCTVPKWVMQKYGLGYGDEIELLFNDVILKAEVCKKKK